MLWQQTGDLQVAKLVKQDIKGQCSLSQFTLNVGQVVNKQQSGIHCLGLDLDEELFGNMSFEAVNEKAKRLYKATVERAGREATKREEADKKKQGDRDNTAAALVSKTPSNRFNEAVDARVAEVLRAQGVKTKSENRSKTAFAYDPTVAFTAPPANQQEALDLLQPAKSKNDHPPAPPAGAKSKGKGKGKGKAQEGKGKGKGGRKGDKGAANNKGKGKGKAKGPTKGKGSNKGKAATDGKGGKPGWLPGSKVGRHSNQK